MVVRVLKEYPTETVVSVLLLLLTSGALAWLMMRWVLELLGFRKDGPVKDTPASWFQSTYGGHVPKGSLMAGLQRRTMTEQKSKY
ncbi:hypothetical protein B0H67DRAFT_582038 [Lasiosphaeris hirsuta]|uniref:Uncharacterized protein n=1 Tax=Lasiosphaeris hirsuta TaxID=260670 RepID=A0AA40DY56_9PEZI|nr:hypothetical protein B0H67DRAFT_582038 [Lasiosphaeris hirsuta]